METYATELSQSKENVTGFVTSDDEGLTGGCRSSTGSVVVCKHPRPPRGTYLFPEVLVLVTHGFS
jgi:hypothetical protein